MVETDAAGTPTAFYLYAGDTLLARILPDDSALWYHPDRQGNVVLLTDGSGSTAADYQYDPFGVPVSASGSFAASNHFRYLGGLGVWDNDDGTLHARARSYHPRLGRFLSNDPLFGSIQDGQSLNRYVYALGDPFGFSDPSGFAPVSGLFYLDTRTANSTAIFARGSANKFGMYQIHVALDGLGFVDAFGIGTVADLANSGLYLVQGDWGNAGTSAFGAIPVVGNAAIVAKIGRRADNLYDAAKTTINPTTVRFSHDSANYTFTAGGTIDDLAAGLRSGLIKPTDVPAIRLVERDGQLFSLDNRRLEAFRRAGVEVPYRMATPQEVADEAWKFTTQNGGVSIRIRNQP